MITSHEVENIKNQLQLFANNSVSGNYPEEWGFDDKSETPPLSGTEGLFVVLYNKDNSSFINRNDKTFETNVLANTGTGERRVILARSTRIPAGLITWSDKTITISNVPYTETISTVTNAEVWQDTENQNVYAKANAFAIVMGSIVETPVEILNEQGEPKDKYVLDVSNDPKVLFEGDIGNGQTIEPNNSFALTNIRITFS